MKTVGRVTVVSAAMAILGTAHAGHEPPVYPSYYPQEIRIEPIAPAAAGRALVEGRIQAYVGTISALPVGAEESIKFVESLGSYLLVHVNPDSPLAADAHARCALAARAVSALAGEQEGFRFHPYPVNPFHADYLHHFDLAAKAKSRFGQPSAAAADGLKIRAAGALAERIVGADGTATAGEWDVSVEEVGLDALLADSRFGVLGWVGPPWLKAGWFHAYLLLAPALPDTEMRGRAEATLLRLQRGDYRTDEERINLERGLVELLTDDCRAVVAGYGLRRWYYNDDYSAGVENIGYDSHAGLRSAIFIRTVKLKDFPWNGWLTLGVPEAPAAAWNPLGGFTDETGRLIWLALGDPALFPEPYDALWSLNRIGDVGRTARPLADAVAVPADAVLPEATTGLFQPVGPGKTAKVALSYGAMTSLFHEGTRTELADILYSFAFAYRWAAEDAGIGQVTALIRERLVGLKPTGVDAASKTFRVGDLEFRRELQLVEVYLNAAPDGPLEAAALAPPWSDVPWHVIALMEEAVTRGWAAFSEEEARRRGVPWLDVVRDARLKERLGGLVDEFADEGFVPAPLLDMVSPDEARVRWQGLRAFFAEHDHFLVTNGPYALKSWSPEATALEVFRDISYPLGVGSFDAYPIPRRAHIAEIEVLEGGIRVAVEIERVEKFARSHRIVREAVADRRTLTTGETLECRYLLVAADGTVRRTSLGRLEEDGTFRIDLDRGDVPPSQYTVLVTVTLNGNAVDPDIRAVPYEVR